MLSLFGRPTLTTPSGRRIEILPTGWRLLAVLAAGPTGGMPRSTLAELVLPTGKLSTLRKLVWNVRQALNDTGLTLIDGDAHALWLAPDVACDVRELAGAKPARALRDIYKASFFDTGSGFRSEAWDAWLAETREAMRKLYVAKATEILVSADTDWSTQVQEARHLLKHAPGHAEAAQILMLRGAQAADAREIRIQFEDLQENLKAAGSRPDRVTAALMHRLVGASQRQLGTDRTLDVMDLPTVYVAPPTADPRRHVGPLLRSLLTDITIGLCRASVFRVIDCEHAVPETIAHQAAPGRAFYVVASSIVDHVLGDQIVFTLKALPRWETLWTERVEASPDRSVSAYNLLTAGVLRSLIRRIRDIEVEAFRLDADPGAYASYLAGSSSLNSLDLAELRQGRNHLRRSMSQSPNFAPTTSALARSYQLEWLVTGRGEQDLLDKARAHSLHAIGSDSLEARGYKALGFCDLYDKRFEAALEHYDRAEQLNKNYADLIAEHANCLLHCGSLEAASEKIDYAMRLNPEHGDMYRWTKACICFLQERYDEVLAIIDLMRDRDPVLRLLAATHAFMGDGEKAKTSRMEAMRTFPTMTIRGWIDTVALKDPQHIQHYSEGLAKAGFN